MGLESCTAEVQVAEELARRKGGDAPGFDGTSKSNAEILKMIAFFLAAA